MAWHKVYLVFMLLYRTIINLWSTQRQKYDFHIICIFVTFRHHTLYTYIYVPYIYIQLENKEKINKFKYRMRINVRQPYTRNFNNFLFLNTHPSTSRKKIHLRTSFIFSKNIILFTLIVHLSYTIYIYYNTHTIYIKNDKFSSMYIIHFHLLHT